MFTDKYVLVDESFVDHRAIFQVLHFLPRFIAVHYSDNIIEKLYHLYSLYNVSHIFVMSLSVFNCNY